MAANKIIFSHNVDEMNAIIKEHNKQGWVVKQIFVNNQFAREVYALLEHQGNFKQ